jgi:hypothetical protein
VALVRPAWVGIIAFALAGLAMLLGWQVTVGSGALALVYLLAASLYNVDVGRELNQRIQFSVRPVGRGQGVLLIALVLVFCGSLCLGYAAYIEREGFSIPESSIEFLMEQWERQFLSSVPEEQRQAPEFETRLAALREDFRRQVDELFARLVEPYKQFIPLIVAAGLFIPLVIATWLLAWVPTIVLSTVLVLLRATGVIRVVRETQEVQRLVM